jgi:hypothetical protein
MSRSTKLVVKKPNLQWNKRNAEATLEIGDWSKLPLSNIHRPRKAQLIPMTRPHDKHVYVQRKAEMTARTFGSYSYTSVADILFTSTVAGLMHRGRGPSRRSDAVEWKTTKRTSAHEIHGNMWAPRARVCGAGAQPRSLHRGCWSHNGGQQTGKTVRTKTLEPKRGGGGGVRAAKTRIVSFFLKKK